MMKKILVAGGAGYIGSHICVELLNEGYETVSVDNLYNSSDVSMKRVEEITGKKLKFYRADFLDKEAITAIFEKEKPDAVIMCAGYKAVGESVRKPIEYYYNNMAGTLILCDEMRNHGVKNIIFSSSAKSAGRRVAFASFAASVRWNVPGGYFQLSLVWGISESFRFRYSRKISSVLRLE